MARPPSRRRIRNNHPEDVLMAPPGSPTRWSNEQNTQDVFSPSPPSKPLPKSEEGRRKSSARRRVSLNTVGADVPQSSVSGDFDPFARRPSRPSSSLSKYKPLPDIVPLKETSNKVEDSPEIDGDIIESRPSKGGHSKRKEQKMSSSETKVKQLSEKRVKETNSAIPVNQARSSTRKETVKSNSITQKIKNEGEHINCDKSTVIELGVKLPTTGDRVCKSFRPSDTLSSVMKFAEEENGSKKLSHTYDLAINMPRKVFRNLKMTIHEAGLQNKTILYLVDKDAD